MGRLTRSVRALANELERAAESAERLRSGGGPGGDASGSTGAVTFLTTVNVAPAISGGSGGGGGAGGGLIGGPAQLSANLLKALAYFGVSPTAISERRQQELLAEFRRLLKENSMALAMRAGAS